jgi:CAAX protease family protein
VEWTLTETVLVFLAGWGLSHYVLLILYGVLALRGSLGATLDSVLGEVAGPAVIFIWLRRQEKAPRAWFGPPWQRAGDVGTGIAAGLGMYLVSAICIGITVAIARAVLGHQPTLPDIARDFHGHWVVAYGVLLTVVAPVCEEFVFRGFLFRGLRVVWGWWPAALVSSVAFALAHASPFRLLNTLAVGLVFAGIYEGRKSLLTNIAAHSALNTLAFVLTVRQLH